MSIEHTTKMQKIIAALYQRDCGGTVFWKQDSHIESLFYTEIAGFRLNIQEYNGSIIFSIIDSTYAIIDRTDSAYQSHPALPKLYAQVRYRVLNIEKQIDELLAYLEK